MADNEERVSSVSRVPLPEWRPEGWENPEQAEPPNSKYPEWYARHRIYEAGADAMLAALREMGLSVPNIRDLEHEDHESTTDDELSPAIARLDGQQGTLVLIPNAPEPPSPDVKYAIGTDSADKGEVDE